MIAKYTFLLACLLATIPGLRAASVEVDLPLSEIGSADLYLHAGRYQIAFKMPRNASDLHKALQDVVFAPVYAALVRQDGRCFAIKMRSDAEFGYTEDEYWDGETHYVYNQESRNLAVAYGHTDISPFAKYIHATSQAGAGTLSALISSYRGSLKNETLYEGATKGQWFYEIEKTDGYAIKASLLQLGDGKFVVENYVRVMPGGAVYSAFINEFTEPPATAGDIFRNLKYIYRLDLSPQKKYECMRYEIQLVRQGTAFEAKNFRPDRLGEINVWDKRVTPSASYMATNHELPLAEVKKMVKAGVAKKEDQDAPAETLP